MLGRIIGRNATELIFRYKYGEDVKIGEILVAEDEEKNKKFFLRVVDLRYGMEWPETWGMRAAGDMILMDEMEEVFTMREKERRLFKLGICLPLGYLFNGRFYKPKAIPSHFAKVRRAGEEDYSFLKKYLGEIEIGMLRSGENVVNVPVGIKKDLLPHHIGIFATTGMGKSNLMRVFASSILQKGGCGLLIIDPHGEYYEGKGIKGLKHHPKASNSLIIYSPHPINGPYNKLSISAYEISVSDIKNVFSFTEAQEDALYALSSRFEKRWLVELCERDVDDLVAIFGKKIQDVTFNVLKRRLERIFYSSIIHKRENFSIADSIIQHLCNEKVVLVDTSGLSENEELLVSVVLARKILNYAKYTYQKRKDFQKMPPFLIVMEEAQRVLQQRENIFSQIAREGRKFKVGLCAITQQPKLIKEEILSQFNTFCILGLADEGDRNILKSSAKQDLSKLDKEIQTLEAGEALVTYPGAPFAIPAKIHWYDDYLEMHNEKKERGNMEIDEEFY